jgi:hypothetical protein
MAAEIGRWSQGYAHTESGMYGKSCQREALVTRWRTSGDASRGLLSEGCASAAGRPFGRYQPVLHVAGTALRCDGLPGEE